MGRKSSITQLPPEIREAVDRAIREGRASADQIVAIINEMGGHASASAVTRYARSARAQMEQFTQATEIAKVWVGKLGADPTSDVGRLVTEMLRTVAWQQVGSMGDDSDGRANETMMLARAIKDLASADKLTVEREARIRKEIKEQAAETAVHSAKKAGLSAAAAADIRRDILGIPA
jgi:Protein of unknown function (DUF3486)